MIILGLDPGIARTGFGIIDTSTPNPYVSCGCLTTTPKEDVSVRLFQLGQDATSLIHRFKPDRAVIEHVFFNTNTTTAILTAQVKGVLLYILQSHHIPVMSLTPLQIKSQLTGFGRADKKQVQLIVQSRLRLNQPPQPDDAADALAAALCAADRPQKTLKPAATKPPTKP